MKLDRGSIRSSLSDGLSTPYRLSVLELFLTLMYIMSLSIFEIQHLVLPTLNLYILDAGILRAHKILVAAQWPNSPFSFGFNSCRFRGLDFGPELSPVLVTLKARSLYYGI